MYGGGNTFASSPQHGTSAMDVAASQSNERGYYRQGGLGNGRPATTASQRTSPLTNKSSPLSNGKNTPSPGGGANATATPGVKNGVGATGLIRLTLKKPMGIVFEPMEDPHNPSQQRGVRICDLPRTGVAAMSGKLEIGDELLSINNKTMSRLTFDEIMDFIIEADADNVHLLFRRPKKDGSNRSGAAVDAKKGSNVKWADNSNNNDKKVVTEVIEPEPEQDENTVEDDEAPSERSPSPPKSKSKSKKSKNKRPSREEESVGSADDTFYTEATDFTEETRQKRRKGRRNRRIESESFLDMLIDSLCAPVMGESGKDYSDDDATYNDDDTYGTYDDSYDERKKKWNERKRRDKEIREKAKKEKKNDKRKSKRGDREREEEEEEDADFKESSKTFHPKFHQNPYNPENDVVEERPVQERNVTLHAQNPPPPPPPPAYENTAHNNYQANQPPPAQANDMNNMNMNHMDMTMNMNNLNFNMDNMNLEPQNHFNPNIVPPKNQPNEESLITDPNCPIKELEYDDLVDHAAEVSVMDSIGGPSLLLENLRNASRIVKTVSPEIIQKFGANYPQELGLTREESIQVDPNKFYRWVVKNLLETHEPEKIRLIDKLFEKYKGREEHLIHKLNARYTDDEEKSKKSGVEKSAAGGSSSEDGGDYDGFKAFGGGDFSKSSESTTKDGGSKYTFGNDGWPATIGEEDEEEEDEKKNEDEGPSLDISEEYSEGDYESVDGTSPEVIAKVSELLNYVYGKTSVPGQIDRVSTIMRAYEGRTGVLLELLETKALLKANADTDNTEEIPEILKSNPGLHNQSASIGEKKEISLQESDEVEEPVLSPISNFTGGSGSRNDQHSRSPRRRENYSSPPRQEHYPEDDYENDFENENQPVDNNFQVMPSPPNQRVSPVHYNKHLSSFEHSPPRSMPTTYSSPTGSSEKKKKKKGFFKGIFKKKKGKNGAFPSSDGGFKKNKKGSLLG